MKQIADGQRVTEATIYYHWTLLRLALAIQAFLLELRHRAPVRRFGMMPLLPLAKLGHEDQLRRFADLTGGRFPVQPSVATVSAVVRTGMRLHTAV